MFQYVKVGRHLEKSVASLHRLDAYIIIGSIDKWCKSKKGCGALKCGCKKKNILCGPGCYCSNCLNVKVHYKRRGPGHE